MPPLDADCAPRTTASVTTRLGIRKRRDRTWAPPRNVQKSTRKTGVYLDTPGGGRTLTAKAQDETGVRYPGLGARSVENRVLPALCQAAVDPNDRQAPSPKRRSVKN